MLCFYLSIDKLHKQLLSKDKNNAVNNSSAVCAMQVMETAAKQHTLGANFIANNLTIK